MTSIDIFNLSYLFGEFRLIQDFQNSNLHHRCHWTHEYPENSWVTNRDWQSDLKITVSQLGISEDFLTPQVKDCSYLLSCRTRADLGLEHAFYLKLRLRPSPARVRGCWNILKIPSPNIFLLVSFILPLIAPSLMPFRHQAWECAWRFSDCTEMCVVKFVSKVSGQLCDSRK